MNFQQVILVGNATADAQRRTSRDGSVAFATFTVGVSDIREKGTYFPIVVFDNQVDAIVQYVTKGKQVLVVGRGQINDQGRFSVIASRVLFGSVAADRHAAQEEESTP